MITPCKKICKIDPHTEICIGCGRFVEEIENWLIYSEEERILLYNEASERLYDDSKREAYEVASQDGRSTRSAKE